MLQPFHRCHRCHKVKRVVVFGIVYSCTSTIVRFLTEVKGFEVYFVVCNCKVPFELELSSKKSGLLKAT